MSNKERKVSVLKILQVVQRPQLRGAEIFACQLSNHLLGLGHNVRMISLFPGESTLPFKGILVHFNRPLKKRLFDFLGWKQLSRYVEEFQPDVVQVNAGDTLKFAVFSKLIYGWKTPIVFRNANKVSDFIDSRSKLVFNKFLMSRIRKVVSVSEICRLDFVKTYSFKPTNTITIPIGVELLPIKRELPADLTDHFKSGKVLVSVASFVREKNHVGLLKIFKRLLLAGHDVKLLLVGDGKLKGEIENMASAMGMIDRVLFLGYRSDVMSILPNAQALVLPSHIEGLPGVIIEAMYCRTPVVAYAVGGISEVIEPNKTGWLIAPNNEDAFVQAVEEVLISDVTQIIENAHDLVLRDFDNKVLARKFESVYKD